VYYKKSFEKSFFYVIIMQGDKKMKNYNLLVNDEELSDLINTVDKVSNLVLGHGRGHTMFVVDTVEYILNRLGYDNHTVELGKVAALLHDIGNLTGSSDHALKSAEMSEYFLDKTTLTGYDKRMIIQAIRDHSDGVEIDTPFGAALLIADQSDYKKDRVLLTITEDVWYKNLLEVEDIEVIVENDKIFINRMVTDKFCQHTMDKNKEAKEMYFLASDYLDCDLQLQTKSS